MRRDPKTACRCSPEPISLTFRDSKGPHTSKLPASGAPVHGGAREDRRFDVRNQGHASLNGASPHLEAIREGIRILDPPPHPISDHLNGQAAMESGTSITRSIFPACSIVSTFGSRLISGLYTRLHAMPAFVRCLSRRAERVENQVNRL